MDAQAWVVGPTGDFKTLRAALMSGKVRSGATLLLQAATYLEVDLPHNGRTHVTIKRHPDATERPIVDGQNKHAVAINALDGWVIEDVVIRNFKGGSPRDAALQGDYPNGSHFTVRNVLLIDVNRGIQQIAGRSSADRALVDRVLVSHPTEWGALLGSRVDAKDLLVLRPGPPEAVRVGADSPVTDALVVGVRVSPGVPVAGIVLANAADAFVRGAVVIADPTHPGAVGIVTSALAGHESNVVMGAFTAVGIGTWAGEDARRPSERVSAAGPTGVDVEAHLERMMHPLVLPSVASIRQYLAAEASPRAKAEAPRTHAETPTSRGGETWSRGPSQRGAHGGALSADTVPRTVTDPAAKCTGMLPAGGAAGSCPCASCALGKGPGSTAKCTRIPAAAGTPGSCPCASCEAGKALGSPAKCTKASTAGGTPGSCPCASCAFGSLQAPSSVSHGLRVTRRGLVQAAPPAPGAAAMLQVAEAGAPRFALGEELRAALASRIALLDDKSVGASVNLPALRALIAPISPPPAELPHPSGPVAADGGLDPAANKPGSGVEAPDDDCDPGWGWAGSLKAPAPLPGIHIAYGRQISVTDACLYDRYADLLGEPADPTGTINSGAAIQAAIDFAIQNAIGTVYIPRGTYRIEQTLIINSDQPGSASSALRIEGDFPVLRAAMPMLALVSVRDVGALTVERLKLDGAGTTLVGFAGEKLSGPGVLIDQVHSFCCFTGIWVYGCTGAVFRACTADHNISAGFRIRGCGASTFDSCRAQSNGGSGFVIEGFDGQRGCWLTNFWSECNDGVGVDILLPPNANTGVRGFALTNGHVERNRGDGISVGASNSTISNVWIVPSPQSPAGSVAIRLLGGTRGNIIHGNQLNGVLKDPFSAIHDETLNLSGESQHWVRANFVAGSLLPGSDTPLLGSDK